MIIWTAIILVNEPIYDPIAHTHFKSLRSVTIGAADRQERQGDILKVTIREVAQHAGVSLGTASRVLNGHSNINPKIVAKVQASIKTLNYTPNLAAQSLKGDRTRSIGIVVHDIAAPAVSGYVTAAQDVLMEAGYALFVASTGRDLTRADAFLQMLAARRVDGLIATIEPDAVARYLQVKPQGRPAPLVLLDRNMPADADAAVIDHAAGIDSAVRYLTGLGHTRIALLTGARSLLPAGARMEGFERAMRAAGLPIRPNFIVTDCFEPKTAFQEAQVLLSGPDRPTAILAGGINAHRAAQATIRKLNDAIGSLLDQQMVDSDLAELATPPITVVTWNSDEMGRAVAQLVLQRINQPDSEPRRLTFPSELIVRESCAAPRK